ncbi:hypothetical protein HU200_032871 [Digitaria exilis]|uniref:Uncharacterized protein n=1 Tax=Digitaria exilis TaxID=1010633 RepID=A0A835BJ84_9POAL|nr:hypothetical protein HU200_032871 [Digitaria exilis]
MAGGWRRKKTTWRGIVPAHVPLEPVGGCDVSRTNITHVFFIQKKRKNSETLSISCIAVVGKHKLPCDPITHCQATTWDAILEPSWCPSKPLATLYTGNLLVIWYYCYKSLHESERKEIGFRGGFACEVHALTRFVIVARVTTGRCVFIREGHPARRARWSLQIAFGRCTARFVRRPASVRAIWIDDVTCLMPHATRNAV